MDVVVVVFHFVNITWSMLGPLKPLEVNLMELAASLKFTVTATEPQTCQLDVVSKFNEPTITSPFTLTSNGRSSTPSFAYLNSAVYVPLRHDVQVHSIESSLS